MLLCLKMSKIVTITEAAKLSAKHKHEGGKVGLITGCFDIVHLGHAKIFQFAKKHCGVVIIGVDSNKSIQLTKGNGRPINPQKARMKLLEEFESIDYIFPIQLKSHFKSNRTQNYHRNLLIKLMPDYLITCPAAVKVWKEKKQRAVEFSIKLLCDKRKRLNTSTDIVEKIRNRG